MKAFNIESIKFVTFAVDGVADGTLAVLHGHKHVRNDYSNILRTRRNLQFLYIFRTRRHF